MPFEADLSRVPEGCECGLLSPLLELAELASSAGGGEWEPVRDRSVWKGLLGADGYSRANLRQFARIRKQTGPSCGSAATVGAYEALLRFGGLDVPALSGGSMFTFVGSRRGSTLRANVERLSKFGVCPESFWPDDRIYGPVISGHEAQAGAWRVDGFRFVPDFDGLVWSIFTGSPGIFGVDWGGTGHLIWGSRVYWSGAKGWGVELANSWGREWGDDGFGVLYEPQIARGIEDRYGAAVLLVSFSV